LLYGASGGHGGVQVVSLEGGGDVICGM
jgi:hypothetical protein